MDYKKTVKGRDTVVDIDNGASESEDDRRNEPMAGNRRSKVLLRSKSGTLTYDDSEGGCSSNSYRSSVKSSDDECDDIESLIYNKHRGRNVEHMPLIGKTHMKEKHKSSNSKKAPKPPRPHKGPSLNTTDLQLVKEISEQAMKKRVRVERLKALKKRRAANCSSSSSSNGSIFAIIVTVLFLLVIILQGFGSSQSSTLSFHDSPKPSGLISIQFGNNILENHDGQQISTPPDFVEQKSGSKPRAAVKRSVGSARHS